ncbi:hypothetical protein AeMF1_010342 [Aphanomyces euteiches]|nr:hypothetical protein AeMF1_010342 [Aphanomyces euteiches]KAH9191717.1 hypothetical protein AeNC1_006312 [Aphanomyces euteiches]
MSGRNGHDQVRGRRDGGSLTKGVYLGSGATRTAYTCRVQNGCVAGYTQGSYLVYKNFKPELAARGYKVGPADAAMQQYCLRLAKMFNDEVEVSKEGFLCPVVIRDAAYKVVPTVGPVLLERKVEGKWTRFTSNSGWTGNNDPIIDFFSHWTYKRTQRELVVTDLQGHRGVPDGPPYLNYEYYYMLTDPCINSVEQEYGINDLGPAGIDAFFQNHKCNYLCRRHGLHGCRPKLRPAQYALPLKRSTTYSLDLIPNYRGRRFEPQLETFDESDEDYDSDEYY